MPEQPVHEQVNEIFRIYYRVPSSIIPLHFHEELEIVFVHSGEGTFFIRNQVYEMTKGDIFLIKENEIHKLTDSADHPFRISVLQFHSSLLLKIPARYRFQPVSLFGNRNKPRPRAIPILPADRSQIEMRLKNISEENDRKRPLHRLFIATAIADILALACRNLENSHKEKLSQRFSPDTVQLIQGILEYIEQHIQKDLSVSILARQMQITPNYFSSVFRKYTGFKFVEFVNLKRVLLAKELLQKTQLKVLSIAFETGFENLSHFNRTFLQIVGTTPTTFRRGFQNRDIILN